MFMFNQVAGCRRVPRVPYEGTPAKGGWVRTKEEIWQFPWYLARAVWSFDENGRYQGRKWKIFNKLKTRGDNLAHLEVVLWSGWIDWIDNGHSIPSENIKNNRSLITFQENITRENPPTGANFKRFIWDRVNKNRVGNTNNKTRNLDTKPLGLGIVTKYYSALNKCALFLFGNELSEMWPEMKTMLETRDMFEHPQYSERLAALDSASPNKEKSLVDVWKSFCLSQGVTLNNPPAAHHVTSYLEIKLQASKRRSLHHENYYRYP